MTTVGIIGAGHIGSAVAEGLLAQGHEVVIANSRGPETLTDLVSRPGERARAASVTEAAEAGEWVVVTVPLKALEDIPAAPLAGKIVLDTNNYYFERDGHIAESRREAHDDDRAWPSATSPSRRWPRPSTTSAPPRSPPTARPPGPRTAGHWPPRATTPRPSSLVTAVYDAFGFDTVDIGSLAETWRVERDQPAYGPRQTAEEPAGEPGARRALSPSEAPRSSCRPPGSGILGTWKDGPVTAPHARGGRGGFSRSPGRCSHRWSRA
ncbi:NAD(P)-binding domain-containing protein [Nocardioides convexus]|uniref:NADPH-dependent F420 reductase n=1 Tax=Nocardioides convexus TaxID=2712224 RepID=UPI002418A529|nr:NAD(P)-binding domain-containing protein [Nocardioides convexus]